MALAILAGLVLLGLVVHSTWSASKKGPRQPVPDSAEAATRVEPTLSGEPAAGAGVEGGGAAVTIEGADGFADTTSPAADDGAPLVPPVRPMIRRPGRIDALIDAIAAIRPEAPVTGEQAIQHLPPTRRAGAKPFHIEGQNTESGDWETPRAGQRYGEFQAGVQMANRHGALNEIEYSEFVQKIEAFAESLGAMADFPDMLDVVAGARELDAFASQHDAQLAVVMRANSVAWSVGYLQQTAGRHGFVPGAVPGRLAMPGAEEGAPPMLVLSFDSQVALADDPGNAALREMTLSLDVPQTAADIEPFAAWQHAARMLADELDATLVDDHGAPITLGAFTAIGQELERLYSALESHDLAAGSAAARRLFS
ncbi:MAG TPA: cell division protein FtsZ [Ideonella sp.]|nr:cell division protein FtsZ [Ideonella sp.]